jgi:hypothetical protein
MPRPYAIALAGSQPGSGSPKPGIVDAAVFLLEDTAVNGVDLIVDGGWHCR